MNKLGLILPGSTLFQMLPFAQEYFVFFPLGFKGNLSLLEMCLVSRGRKRKWKDGQVQSSLGGLKTDNLELKPLQPKDAAQLFLFRSSLWDFGRGSSL